MIRFFVDFDGTISTQDVVDLVLDRFADSRWRDIEKKWQDAQIGSRDCLSQQMALVRASQVQIKQLLKEVGVDSYFQEFLKWAEQSMFSVAIVSDGFNFFIDEILKRSVSEEFIKNIPIYSNTIEWTAEGPRAVFSQHPMCEHGCANCKPKVMRALSEENDTIYFVGDGLSDRYAAENADLTFAKGKLLAYCRENKLRHQEYRTFGDIQSWALQKKSF